MKNSGPPTPTGVEKSPSNARTQSKIPRATYTHSGEKMISLHASVHHNTCECVHAHVCHTHTHTHKRTDHYTYTLCKRIKHQKKPKSFIKASERGCQRFFLKMKARDILSFRLISHSLSLPLSKSLKYHPCFNDKEGGREREREKGG